MTFRALSLSEARRKLAAVRLLWPSATLEIRTTGVRAAGRSHFGDLPVVSLAPFTVQLPARGVTRARPLAAAYDSFRIWIEIHP